MYQLEFEPYARFQKNLLNIRCLSINQIEKKKVLLKCPIHAKRVFLAWEAIFFGISPLQKYQEQ